MIEANRIINGDVLAVLKMLPNECVQTVVTSPPYWGLRDYGVDGQLGREESPLFYVEKMTVVFREIHRVLKKDGTLWLNLGDSYVTNPSNGRGDEALEGSNPHRSAMDKSSGSLKTKDLVGIPWRVAFALQSDGWYLRSDIIWSKPNPMPESVQDRPTKAHEYIFLLSRSERYYYDAKAIRTTQKDVSIERLDRADLRQKDGWDNAFAGNPPNGLRRTDKQRGHSRKHAGFNDRWDHMEKEQQLAGGANARTVWGIATQPFHEAHFATFPEEIPKRCVLAGSRPGDLVLDPFMGAGTVAVIAKRLKRDWLGIELNTDYIKIAEKRIANEPEPLLVEGAA